MLQDCVCHFGICASGSHLIPFRHIPLGQNSICRFSTITASNLHPWSRRFWLYPFRIDLGHYLDAITDAIVMTIAWYAPSFGDFVDVH